MTLVRVGLAAVALTPFGLAALRGRWGVLRRNLGLLVAYGAIAVAGAQFCYFSAVQHMQVGPAILIEFTAPAAVVVFLWLRHGQRPGRMTLAGAGARGARAGAGARPGLGRRPERAGCALVAGRDGRLRDLLHHQRRRGQRAAAAGPGLGRPGGRRPGARRCSGSSALLPMHASTDPAAYAGVDVAWWLPLLALGLVSAALSYVAGIAAGRRLGSRLASFVALLEVVASVGWAWLLLDELPGAVQLRRRPADPGRSGRGQARRAHGGGARAGPCLSGAAPFVTFAGAPPGRP